MAGGLLLWANSLFAMTDLKKIVGPNVCAECHSAEAKVWRGSHHAKSYRSMPASDKGKAIGRQLGIKKITDDQRCASCHFTQQDFSGISLVLSGVSCESCHGAGNDWIKVHGKFSGKKKGEESLGEIKARWATSEAAGMIRPYNIYSWAQRCLACHLVSDPVLVEKTEHPSSSAFELVAWTQGEIRHNFWSSNRTENLESEIDQLRLLFVVGVVADFDASLRALGRATSLGKYAETIATRVVALRAKLRLLSLELPEVEELVEIVGQSENVRILTNNTSQLKPVSEAIDRLGRSIAEEYTGAEFEAIDHLLPKVSQYRGSPVEVK